MCAGGEAGEEDTATKVMGGGEGGDYSEGGAEPRVAMGGVVVWAERIEPGDEGVELEEIGGNGVCG